MIDQKFRKYLSEEYNTFLGDPNDNFYYRILKSERNDYETTDDFILMKYNVDNIELGNKIKNYFEKEGLKPVISHPEDGNLVFENDIKKTSIIYSNYLDRVFFTVTTQNNK